MWLKSVSIFCLLMAMFAGCGGSDEFVGAPSGPQTPSGPLVHVEGPGPGVVEVQDRSGRVLGSANVPLSIASVRLIEDPEAIVVAFTFDDPYSSQDAIFKAEIPDPATDEVVALDPISTLIAMYHERHPEISFEEAVRRVFEFMQLPPGTDPQHLRTPSPFHEEEFLAQAQLEVGYDNLFSSLLDEMERAPTSSRNFVGEGLADVFTPSGIATELAKGALGHVGGEALGWLAGKIGLGGASPDSQILKTLAAVQAQIADLTNLIKQLAGIQLYATKDAALVDQRAKVKEWTDEFRTWTDPSNTAPPSTEQVNTRMALIASTLTGILGKVDELEQDDVNGGAGLTRLYIEASTHNKLWVDKFYDTYSAHFRQSSRFQELAVNLLNEVNHHSDPAQLLKAETLAGNLLANLKRQRNLYPLPYETLDPAIGYTLDELLLTDPRSGLIWYRRPLRGPYLAVEKILTSSSWIGNAPEGAFKIATEAQIDTLFNAMGDLSSREQNVLLGREGFIAEPGKEFGDFAASGRWNFKVFTSDAIPSKYRGVPTLQTSYIDLRTRERGKTFIHEELAPYPYPEIQAAFLVCREAPKVQSLAVTEVQVPGAKVFERNYKVEATLSDGTKRDMTRSAVWSVNVDGLHAHISNTADTSGRLTLRAPTTDEVKVTASFRDIVSPGTTVPGWQKFTLSSVFVVVSPVRSRINSYPTTRQFTAVRTTNNGQVFSTNASIAGWGIGPLTWETNDPSVTVSSEGLVQFPTKPATPKTVKISARLSQNLRSEAEVILE